MRKNLFNWIAAAFLLCAWSQNVLAADPTPSISISTLLTEQPAVGTWFRIESASSNGNVNNRNTFMYGAIENVPGYFIQPDAARFNTGHTHPVANTFEDGFLWTLESAGTGTFYLKNKLGLYVYFANNISNGVSVLSRTNKTAFTINNALFSGNKMFGFQVVAGFNLSCDANTTTRGNATLNGDGGNPAGGGAKANAFWLHGVPTKTVSAASNDLSKGTVAIKNDVKIDLKYDAANLTDITKTTVFDHFAYKTGDPGDELALSVVKATLNNVTVVATPAAGQEFSGWVNTTDENAVLSTEPTFVYTGTSDIQLKAIFFTPSSDTKTVTVTATEGGVVSIVGTSELQSTVSVDANVTVTAVAATGYLFEKWIDANDAQQTALATTAQYVYSGQSDITLKAVFKALSSISRTLTVSAEIGGSVQIDGTSELSKTATADQAIVAIATPANGYKFVKWVNASTNADVATTASYSYTGTGDLALKATFIKLNGHTQLQFSTAENPIWYTINAYYSTNGSSKWNLLSFYDETNSRWIAKGQSNTTTATETFTEPDAALWRLEGDMNQCYLINKATDLKLNNPATAEVSQRYILTETGTPFSVGKSNSVLATLEPDAFYFDPINPEYSSKGRLNVDGTTGEFTLFKNGTADITGGKASSLVFVPVTTKTVTVLTADAAKGSVSIQKDSIAVSYASNRFTFAASTETETATTVVRSVKDPITIVATPSSEFEFEKWIDATGTTVSTDSVYTFSQTADVTYTAQFKQANPTSVEEVGNKIKVWAEEGRIRVVGAIRYTVTDLSGVKVDTAKTLDKGLYFVSVEGVTYKVIVK